jgi:hypothetical protein
MTARSGVRALPSGCREGTAQHLRSGGAPAAQHLRRGATEYEETGHFLAWHIICKGTEHTAVCSGADVHLCAAYNQEQQDKIDMKMNQWLAMAGVAAVMSLGANQVVAQPNDGGGRGRGPGGPGGGGFDMAQFQQRMMERTKEMLEVTNDDEWKAIEPRVQKVRELQRDAFSGMGRGMFGRGPRPGDNPPSGDQGQQRRGGMFGTPNPDADALQKAIDAKAPKAELKAALEKYAASRKAKQAEMEKAQAALRELLTPRQEAIATLNGLL